MPLYTLKHDVTIFPSINHTHLGSIKVSDKELEWKMWQEVEAPETATIPCRYSELDTFRRLLLVRCWCPDRTLHMAKTYVTGMIMVHTY